MLEPAEVKMVQVGFLILVFSIERVAEFRGVRIFRAKQCPLLVKCCLVDNIVSKEEGNICSREIFFERIFFLRFFLREYFCERIFLRRIVLEKI